MSEDSERIRQSLDKEAQRRLEGKISELTSLGKINSVNIADLQRDIRDQVYQEQADREREYDEYVRTTWG